MTEASAESAELVPPTISTTHATPTSLKRVATAACIGTAIEWYDFFIYGLAAALVFPTVFFPALGATAGTVAAFATFGAAFVARPLGALLFGHYGDCYGRKKTLVATLLLMGTATVAIGLLPGAEAIGVAAPIILVVLRLAQGVSVGGEWAGAVLLTSEYAPEGRRGRFGMFPQIGPAIAYGLASATFLITGLTIGNTNEVFLDYGWRIPFVLSAVLVVIGLYVRLKIDETPVFTQQIARGAHAQSAPLLDVLRTQFREILLGAGVLLVMFGTFYIGTAYLTSYGTSPTGAGLEPPVVLGVGVFASVVFGATTMLSAIYSDRFGRRRVIITSCALLIPWLLVLFPLIESGSALAFTICVPVTLGLFGIGYGPVGALLPELFQTRHRYTGAGLSYNLAGILGGAVPPIVAAPLAESFGGIAIGIMLAALALTSLICMKVIAETKDHSLTR